MLNCLCQRDRPRPQQNAGNRGYGQSKRSYHQGSKFWQQPTLKSQGHSINDWAYIRHEAKLKSAAEKFSARRSRSVTPDRLGNFFRQAGLTIGGESIVETQDPVLIFFIHYFAISQSENHTKNWRVLLLEPDIITCLLDRHFPSNYTIRTLIGIQYNWGYWNPIH